MRLGIKRFEVTVKSGRTDKWGFEEYNVDNDSDSKIYIRVIKPWRWQHSYPIDIRGCVNYNFHKECLDHILKFYDDELVELSEVLIADEKVKKIAYDPTELRKKYLGEDINVPTKESEGEG